MHLIFLGIEDQVQFKLLFASHLHFHYSLPFSFGFSVWLTLSFNTI